ncbi:hypothetical protein L1D13_17485 [Vibrio tubiashii]|uniref:hypothetical protein n=1 Tax=Vibrio tubiashii TaxID=29498 RepID=UPI001EFD48D3|nr:hypothetical protein [Vibrio tubiashii]MCG9580573.1 hypothetical protein [Vibrio tubiashii]MCG9614164.1 hypothetical protein [Vibrio tubiashii]MCG9688699.1 hypothetical protein [Vibrio tubiashii]
MKKEALAALLATIMAGPIGYYFNDWQTKDSISIEQVEAIPVFSKTPFNKEIIHDLNFIHSFHLPIPISMQSYEWYGTELTNDQVNSIIYQLEHISLFVLASLKHTTEISLFLNLKNTTCDSIN